MLFLNSNCVLRAESYSKSFDTNEEIFTLRMHKTLVCDEVGQKADFPKKPFPQTATVGSIVLVGKILLL